MHYLLSLPDLGVDWSAPGEFIKFAILGVFMIACAIGVARFSRAAYAAICMIGVMVGFALMYLLNGAEFMGVVQIVVYTGAIMMLFLFVLMLIGIGATDNYKEGPRAHRGVSYVLSLLVVMGLGIGLYKNTHFIPFADAQHGPGYRSMESLGQALFGGHLFTIEIAAILLITAAIGALLLTHSDRLVPKRTQRQVAEAKMAAYAARQRHPGQLPPPGVYAESNAFDVPAISGETHEPVMESVPRVLRVRGINRTVGEVSPVVAARLMATRYGNPADGAHGVEATQSVALSGAWGMPGPAAPQGLRQKTTELTTRDADDEARAHAPETPHAPASDKKNDDTATKEDAK